MSLPGIVLALLLVVPGDDPVEREWTIRHRALFLDASRAALLADLGATGRGAWPRRAAALEALRRGLAAAPGDGIPWARPAILPALGDPHPNVRALALAALAAGGGDEPLPRERALGLAADPLPAVRLALAEALAALPCAAAADLLSALARDPDERVARAARAGLFGLGGEVEGAAAAQIALLVELDEGRAADELLEAAGLLQRGRPARGVVDALRARFAPGGWSAVFEALSFALFGEGDLERLIDGWLTDGDRDPRRQALLLAAGRRAPERVGEGLLGALDEVGRLEVGSAPGPSRPRFHAEVRSRLERGWGIELLHLRFDLFEAAEAILGADGIARRLALRAPPPATAAFLLAELGRRVEGWDRGRDATWLAPERPAAVRHAAIEGFAATFSRTGDAEAGALLAVALGDADPANERLAFRSLCEIEEPGSLLGALHARWLALDREGRIERLPWLPRGVRLEPFRGDLIELAQVEPAARRQAVELLEAFEGDGVVRSHLERWLGEELARLVGLEERRGSPQHRASELRAQGLLRALRRVAPSDCVPALAEALAASLGRSTDVGKTAAWALAASPAGLAILPPYLGPDVDRRTRIEVAIGLASRAGGAGAEVRDRAVASLVEDYRHAAWDLRVRMIDALAEAGGPRADLHLRGVLFGGRSEPEDRRRALGAMARRGGTDAVRATLLRAARGDPDLETRLAAIALLGGAARRAEGELLEGLLAELAAGEAVGEIQEEERVLLRVGILAALAERGGFPRGLEAELLRAPLDEAAATLERRFRGAAAPVPAFAWRGELRALGRLAAEGRLPDVLAAAGPWWRLDARLLLALGDLARGEGDAAAARDLYRAGWIASQGEDRPDADRVAAARCRLLGLLWSEGEWGAFARLARTLLGQWRGHRLAESVWIEAFGAFDRRRGVDPPARLQSAVLQAGAWAAHGRGEGEAARALALEAASLLGWSRLAASEQARLRAALGMDG